MTGLPPYNTGMQRKDSFSGGSDGNDYAYVEDFACKIPPATNPNDLLSHKENSIHYGVAADGSSHAAGRQPIKTVNCTGQPAFNQLVPKPLPGSFRNIPEMIVTSSGQTICGRPMQCPPLDVVQFRGGPALGGQVLGSVVNRPPQQYFVVESSSQYGALQ